MTGRTHTCGLKNSICLLKRLFVAINISRQPEKKDVLFMTMPHGNVLTIDYEGWPPNDKSTRRVMEN